LVNGKRTDVPSFIVKVGDSIEVREKSKKIQALQDSLDAVVRRGVPQWLDLQKDGMKGAIKAIPLREDLTMPMQEQLIVELYSK
jgi:small subunit ribosomal protein S4